MKRLVLVVSSLVLIFQVAFPPQQARAAEPINFKRGDLKVKDKIFALDKSKIVRDRDLSQAKFNKNWIFLEDNIKNNSYMIIRDVSKIVYILIDKTKPLKLVFDERTNVYHFEYSRLGAISFGYYNCQDDSPNWCMADYSDNFMKSPAFLYPVGARIAPSADIVGIYAKQRIEYPEGYSGDTFVGGDTPVNNFQRRSECDSNLAFVCFFQKALSTVVDGISSLFQGLVSLFQGLFDFFKNMFIPSEMNFFAKFFEPVDKLLHKKLGFLTYPFDFFGKAFGATVGTLTADDMREWHCRNTDFYKPAVCSGVCVDNLLSNNRVCLRVGALEENFPVLWNTVIPLARLGFVFTLMSFCVYKFTMVVMTS